MEEIKINIIKIIILKIIIIITTETSYLFQQMLFE